MQNQILRTGPLLDENGELTNPGWAKHLILDYKRNAVKALKFRIKEWDYYCIINHESKKGIALTIADNSYMGLLSASFIDLNTPMEVTKTNMKLFTNGTFNLPETSRLGNISINQEEVFIEFVKDGEERRVSVVYDNFHEGKSLRGEISLCEPDDMDTMVIATPFSEDKKAFYYNQKINCMSAEGVVYFGDEKITFSKTNSFGVLDWGRGVWPYSNTWYWSSASGQVDGIPFGFNLGYGFGDTSQATENVIFYNNRAHKLEDIKFVFDEEEYYRPWKLISSDGRFEMDFKPIIDRYSNNDLKILKSVQHQVFGYFSGRAVLDDGKEIIIKDFLGFAEKVFNKW